MWFSVTDSWVLEVFNVVLSCLALTMPSKEKGATGTQFLFEESAALEIRKDLVCQTRCAVLVPALFFCFKSLLSHTYILPHPAFTDHNSVCPLFFFFLLDSQPIYSLRLQNRHFWVFSWKPVYNLSILFSSQADSKKSQWRKGQIWRADAPSWFSVNAAFQLAFLLYKQT